MESQEYTVSYFKAGDYKDNYGNTWCEATLEEFGEPVRWVVKDPTKVKEGQKVYGHIEEATSKAGKPYNRFKTDKRPDDTPKPYQPKQESPETQENIARSVALKAAVDRHANQPKLLISEVLATADEFLAWLQNTGSQGKHTPEATQAPVPPEARDSEEPDAEWSLDNMPIPPEEDNDEGGSTRDWERLGKG